NAPERARLREVVNVLREADLVDAGGARPLDERVDGPRVVRDLAAPVAKMQVVVGDHVSGASRSRSAASVIFASRGSPGTIFTRPPLASTRDARPAPRRRPALPTRPWSLPR